MSIMGFRKSKSPKTKKAKKPKKKTLGQLHKKLVELCQKWSRISQADDRGNVLCISCGKVMHWKKAHGGHYIPKTCYATRYSQININPQCPACNIFLNGNLIAYREALVAVSGEEKIKELEQSRKKLVEYSREWLEMQIVDYERQIRIMEKGLI